MDTQDPVKNDISIYKGSTYRKTIIWKAGAKGNEEPVDLTGCSASMQIRDSALDNIILHQMSTDNSGITLGGTTGEIELYISNTDSSDFTFNKAVYGLEIYFPNGDHILIFYGDVLAIDEIVR